MKHLRWSFLRKELTLPKTYSGQSDIYDWAFTKIVNGSKPRTFSTKSSILDILLTPENASGYRVFNYFYQKLHLKSLICLCIGLICLCIYLVRQFWRWVNEISKVCYEETQNNCTKYVIFENSCSKKFLHFQEKHPHQIIFLSKVAGYLTLTGNAFLRNI